MAEVQEHVGNNVTQLALASVLGFLLPEERVAPPTRQSRDEKNIIGSQNDVCSMGTPVVVRNSPPFPEGFVKPASVSGGANSDGRNMARANPTKIDADGSIEDGEIDVPARRDYVSEPPQEDWGGLVAVVLLEKMMHLFRHGTPESLELELKRVGEGNLRALRTPEVGSFYLKERRVKEEYRDKYSGFEGCVLAFRMPLSRRAEQNARGGWAA